MLYKQLAEILKVHQLKFQKKKCKKLPIKKCPMLFVVGMFSHLSASARDHYAKLQQGSHATPWPVEQAGQTLHRGSSKSWYRKVTKVTPRFGDTKKTLGFGSWGAKNDPKVSVFWGGLTVQWNTTEVYSYFRELLGSRLVSISPKARGVTSKISPQKRRYTNHCSLKKGNQK